MNRRTIRLVLWIAALVALPVPFFLGEPELAPVLRLAFLSTLMGAVLVAEGGGTIGILAGIGVLQTLLFGTVLWLVAHVLARAFEWLFAPGPRSVLVTALVLGLFAAAFGEIYDTPLSSTRPRSNWTQLFE